MAEQNKGMYHSLLEKFTNEHGQVWLTLKDSPTDSVNTKLAGFVTVTDWNNAERYINIENQRIRAALASVPVGTLVQIKAGGKGEDAWMTIADQNGTLIADSRNGAAPAASAPSGGPGQPPQQGAGPGSPPPAQQSSGPGTPPPPRTNGADKEPITREHYRTLKAAHAVMSQIIEEFPGDLAGASPDAKLEFIRCSATNYRMDLVHNPDRPLYKNEPTDD